MATVATLSANLGLNSEAFQAGLDRARHRLDGFGGAVRDMNSMMRQTGVTATMQMLRGAGAVGGFIYAAHKLNAILETMNETFDKITAGQISFSLGIEKMYLDTLKGLPIFGEFYRVGENLGTLLGRIVGYETAQAHLAAADAVQKQTDAMEKQIEIYRRLSAQAFSRARQENLTARTLEDQLAVMMAGKTARERGLPQERIDAEMELLTLRLDTEKQVLDLDEKIAAARARQEAAETTMVANLAAIEIKALERQQDLVAGIAAMRRDDIRRRMEAAFTERIAAEQAQKEAAWKTEFDRAQALDRQAKSIAEQFRQIAFPVIEFQQRIDEMVKSYKGRMIDESTFRRLLELEERKLAEPARERGEFGVLGFARLSLRAMGIGPDDERLKLDREAAADRKQSREYLRQIAEKLGLR